MPEADAISLKMILIVVLAVAAAVLVLLMVLQKKKRPVKGRTGYISALYALIEGRKDDALRLLTEAVRSGETDIDAYIQLGNLLRERKMPEKALQIHRSLTVRRDLGYDQEKSVQLALAQDLADIGKMDRAIAALDAIHRKRKDPEIAWMLHRLYHRAGDHDNAFAVMKSIPSASGRTAEAERAAYLACVASIHRDAGDTDGAWNYIRKARKQDPGSVPAIYLSAAIRMEDSDYPGAARDWTDLLKRDLSCFDEVMPRLEKCLFESGDYDRLEGILEDLHSRSGGDPAVGVELAAYHIKKGETEKGLLLLGEEKDAGGEASPAVTLRAASLYLDAGSSGQARKVLEKRLAAGARKPGYTCPVCGTGSSYPQQYCAECSSRKPFDRSR